MDMYMEIQDLQTLQGPPQSMGVLCLTEASALPFSWDDLEVIGGQAQAGLNRRCWGDLVVEDPKGPEDGTSSGPSMGRARGLGPDVTRELPVQQPR